jgi:hypothetical protein
MPRRPRSSPAPQISRGDRSPEELLQSNLFVEDLIRRGYLRRQQQDDRERAATARRAIERQQNRHQQQYEARHRAAATASRSRIEAAGIARRARRGRGNSYQGRNFPRTSGVAESEPPVAFPVDVPTPSSPPPPTTPYSELLNTTPVLRSTVYSCTAEQYLIVVRYADDVYIRYLPRGDLAAHFGLPPREQLGFLDA